MGAARDIPNGAVGLGWRRPLAVDLLRAPEVVDFVEVIADNALADRRQRRELAAVAEVWPVVPHGVKLSLGSVHGFDVRRARAYGALARELRAPFVSEHIAFVRAGHIDIGHLTQLPRTEASARVVAENARRAQDVIPVPLLLENVAWSVRSAGVDTLDEPAFIRRVLELSGCGLLLDVANLYANAKNEGLDPTAVIDRYPLERTAMLHVAGSASEEGFVFDTHAHAVLDDVMALVERVRMRIGPRPILLERDRGFCFADHVRELARLRALPARADAPSAQTITATCMPASSGDRDALASLQTRVARALTGAHDGAADVMLAPELAAEEVARARRILARKQLEEAPARRSRVASLLSHVMSPRSP